MKTSIVHQIYARYEKNIEKRNCLYEKNYNFGVANLSYIIYIFNKIASFLKNW